MFEHKAVQDYEDMMQDLRDWAQQWYSDLTQRATDGTEWQEWCVAFMTDVLLSGSNEALREPDSNDEQPSAGTACRSSCPRWSVLLGWLLLPFLSDAVGEERLRHHAQHRKMGNTHRRNDAEGAHLQQAQRRERATHGLALLPFSVSTKTALGCYVPNGRRFLDFALVVNLPMMSREEIDDSPLELWAVLDEAMRLAGRVGAADAAEVALDAYLRSAELFALQAADIVVDVGEAGEQIVALRLGVTERGERTKTGVRQGVLIDRRHVSDMLVRRKSERGPSDRVFSCSVDAYRRALRRACDDVGVEHFPPRAARHSGPSHDAATGYRTARAIQRRGRWASEKSVLRYMKTHALVAARAAPPPDILERG
ncbi:unnamed protein product, partial [Prorocentrum cordatum]